MGKKRPVRSQPPGTVSPVGGPRPAPFTPEVLDKTIIALPLFEMIRTQKGILPAGGPGPLTYPVIIDLNLEYRGGRAGARERVIELIEAIRTERGIAPAEQPVLLRSSRQSQQYVYATLSADVIAELARRDAAGESPPPGGTAPPPAGPAPAPPADTAGPGMGVSLGRRAIYHIWPDFEIERQTTKSVSTVKADAARTAFSAWGEGIVWAVVDSGVDAGHEHFRMHRNLELDAPLEHTDFVTEGGTATADPNGHGTHVAGIIAGEFVAGTTVEPAAGGGQANVTRRIEASVRSRDEASAVVKQTVTGIGRIAGMAPRCKILSLRVLDDRGRGRASSLIAALEYIQELNGHGRRLRVHGVNLSVGYAFDPEWFACGQSPPCVEVDRLVRSGVVVVVAAGNTGYGFVQSQALGQVAAGMDLSINDPGNAELAITVGSTHREMPHTYGVSYFSSKGPTGDGRLKPDLVAPGEKIISCEAAPVPPPAPAAPAAPPTPAPAAAPPAAAPAPPGPPPPVTVVAKYKEDSGTSMAAPHVSGVIAGFLSVRPEYLGRPEDVKEVFLSTATDLRRVPEFQGKGLVDMMRALQSV